MTDIRKQRLEKRILVLISEFYFKQLRDYDTGMTTFIRCELSRDSSYAKIYISTYNNTSEVSPIFDLLKKYTYDLRGLIAKNIRIQNIPTLDFLLDDTLQKSFYVNTLSS